MSLGRKLKELRDNLDLTQKVVATRAKIDPGYLSRLENDKVPSPSATCLARLAAALDVHPNVLLQAAGLTRQVAAGDAVDEAITVLTTTISEELPLPEREALREYLEILLERYRRRHPPPDTDIP